MNEGIKSNLAQVARWTEGELSSVESGTVEFFGVGTDSRALPPGSLFIALRGERHDGHDHVAAAATAGAVAAMVERLLPIDLPQVVVPDARVALGKLGAAWRAALHLPLVAITGSNGKTTTKEMIAAILARRGAVLATRGNLNNELGVPLTLLRLTPEHRFAVIEMGANHHGEIAYLTRLACPQVAVLTNAGPAHLEGFGSLEGVARAKSEIYEGLGEEGTAVVNADSPFASLWRERAYPRRVVTFGLEQPADVTASCSAEPKGSHLNIRVPRGEFELYLPLPGRHNVMNALAATAAALALGVEVDAIREGLESLGPVHGRLELRAGRNGAQLIDDTYNANPASLRAGLEVLIRHPGRHLLALGEMRELGPQGGELHAEMGRVARELGVDALYATGELGRAAVAAFGPEGHFFPEQSQLIAALQGELAPGVTVLIKGSRTLRMERVVEALAAEGES